MSYPEGDMEPSEGSKARESSESEDPRINDYSGEYLQMFAVVFPELTRKQISKATEFSLALARKRVEYEDKAQKQVTGTPQNNLL
ncbi:MAG: hypothetical protein Q7R77_03350 [Candidatus Daviesbacteria bacterium]|nr:hypothetical protein [Candidatus Daviesbacteria bacterium]